MNAQHATATRPRHGAPVIVDVEEAEAALVENYPHLVRLAYLTLPPSLGRHRRVLTAHTLTQGALPRSPCEPDPAVVDVAGPRGTIDPAYALMRHEVLDTALVFGRERGWRGRLRRALMAGLAPHVLGLRLHTKATGTDEAELDRALAGLNAAGRAAYALLELERPRHADGREVRRLLLAAGVADPRGALKAAKAVPEGLLLGGSGLDPCTVRARPTDLLRRRQRVRVGLAAAGAVVVAAAAALVAVLAGGLGPDAAGGSPGPYGAAGLLDPAKLVRVENTAWTRASRVDFTAWPTRGSRAGDRALLVRAMAVWARPSSAVAVSATKGTSGGLPAQQPQLLYAGDVDEATVVLMYDGLRLVRYAEPRGGGGTAALDFARVDGAGVTTAAVVLGRTNGNTRFLTAPWVAGAASRDLRDPGRAPAKLDRTADGVTEPVRMPGADSRPGVCGDTWPALEFRAADGLGLDRPFLLSDLGDLVPAHLTYQPPKGGTPLEATGPAALAHVARTACTLSSMSGLGTRSVNVWRYATQRLPEDNGQASWVCARADTWRGTDGRTLALFLPPVSEPGAQGAPVGQSDRDGGACGRAVPRVLAGVLWKSAAGHWYLLAAGSRDVARIKATGGVTGSSKGPTMAVRAAQDSRAELSAVLDSGAELTTLR
ncbi:hypothetical protein [Actinacidiphila sp. bgisy167]|uniref:hypothetical protein n=1 Tax=Actinacidiphila sp. bgisy167 TaxID=3413797 RepID=UPI003D711259